ncbi:hypothetical protein SARC_10276, partial [Sphaeroforma arctica JP610]
PTFTAATAPAPPQTDHVPPFEDNPALLNTLLDAIEAEHHVQVLRLLYDVVLQVVRTVTSKKTHPTLLTLMYVCKLHPQYFTHAAIVEELVSALSVNGPVQ